MLTAAWHRFKTHDPQLYQLLYQYYSYTGFLVIRVIVRVKKQQRLPFRVESNFGCKNIGATIDRCQQITGICQIPMESLSPIKIITNQGLAKLTFYRPHGSKNSILALYINHHGGGFVVGYAKQDDLICRYLAWHSDSVVVNVDYLPAPEHPCPIRIA